MADNDNDVPNAPASPGAALVNGVKMIGEVAVMPGVSLIADGNLKPGVLHAVAAVAGVAILGPVLGPLAWIGAAASSYSRSVTGRDIREHFRRDRPANT